MKFLSLIFAVLAASATSAVADDSKENELLTKVSEKLVVTQSMEGALKIEWIDPDDYADVRRSGGFPNSEKYRHHVFKEMHHAFEELMDILPDGYRLNLQVTDVDLAGDTRVASIGLGAGVGLSNTRLDPMYDDVRVMRQIDFPRINLRYQVINEAGDEVMSEEVKVRDMNYLQSIRGARASRPLYYERQMLSDWFKSEFKQFRSSDA